MLTQSLISAQAANLAAESQRTVEAVAEKAKIAELQRLVDSAASPRPQMLTESQTSASDQKLIAESQFAIDAAAAQQQSNQRIAGLEQALQQSSQREQNLTASLTSAQGLITAAENQFASSATLAQQQIERIAVLEKQLQEGSGLYDGAMNKVSNLEEQYRLYKRQVDHAVECEKDRQGRVENASKRQVASLEQQLKSEKDNASRKDEEHAESMRRLRECVAFPENQTSAMDLDQTSPDGQMLMESSSASDDLLSNLESHLYADTAPLALGTDRVRNESTSELCTACEEKCRQYRSEINVEFTIKEYDLLKRDDELNAAYDNKVNHFKAKQKKMVDEAEKKKKEAKTLMKKVKQEIDSGVQRRLDDLGAGQLTKEELELKKKCTKLEEVVKELEEDVRLGEEEVQGLKTLNQQWVIGFELHKAQAAEEWTQREANFEEELRAVRGQFCREPRVHNLRLDKWTSEQPQPDLMAYDGMTEEEKIAAEYKAHTTSRKKSHEEWLAKQAYERRERIRGRNPAKYDNVPWTREVRLIKQCLLDVEQKFWNDRHRAAINDRDVQTGMVYFNPLIAKDSSETRAAYFAYRGDGLSDSKHIEVAQADFDEEQPLGRRTLPLREMEDGIETEIFALECAIARLPECQLEAAAAFLTTDQQNRFHARAFQAPDAPRLYSCRDKEIFPALWNKVVRLLRSLPKFKSAAVAFADGVGLGNNTDDSLNKDITWCWPVLFCNIEVIQDLYDHDSFDDAEEARMANYRPCDVKDENAVNRIATRASLEDVERTAEDEMESAMADMDPTRAPRMSRPLPLKNFESTLLTASMQSMREHQRRSVSSANQMTNGEGADGNDDSGFFEEDAAAWAPAAAGLRCQNCDSDEEM